MKWTLEVDRVVEKAGFRVQETKQGLILHAKGDPRALFSASALHVLTMYVCCAMIGADVGADTFLAACDFAPHLAEVPAAKVAEGVQAVLLSEHPEMIGPLAASGGLAHAGIGEPGKCLGVLNSVPAQADARWWTFLHLCGADMPRAAAALKLPEKLRCSLSVYESLFSCAAPGDLLALKVRLSRMPPFDFETAAKTFAVFSPAWERSEKLYRSLSASGEPYRISQLAVTPPELTAAGVPARKMRAVLSQLLSAVQRTPALNTPAALLALARTLSNGT